PAILDHRGSDGDVRVHLDCRSGYLSVALRIMEVANGETAAIDEAGEVDRGSLAHVSNIQVAAEFPRRNCTQAFSGVAAFGSAQRGRLGGVRVRFEHGAAGIGKL